jgi:16S rRNA (guanine527-N7)-methyltransferase
VNPITGFPLPPAAAGPAIATVPHDPESSWAGLMLEAERIGVPLESVALGKFARYRDRLLERNALFNLTAIRDPEGVERRLFLDALALVPALDAFLKDRKLRKSVRLIDIGSGAGFPGLALKIARPEFDVTLVDATAKKVAFLDEVIAALELESVRAVHGRAEALGRDPKYRERFDVVTARAVASLPVLLELAMPFLDIGGQAFFPKGMQINDEVRRGKGAAKLLGAEIVSIEPTPTGDTRLVIARKSTLTPKAYPRREGVPHQSPLGGEA